MLSSLMATLLLCCITNLQQGKVVDSAQPGEVLGGPIWESVTRPFSRARNPLSSAFDVYPDMLDSWTEIIYQLCSGTGFVLLPAGGSLTLQHFQ